MFGSWVGRRTRGGSRTVRRRPAWCGPRLEPLEPRLALAITLPIQDASGLASAGYDVWVTGHGIPGWQPAGAPPLYLMSLGSDGSFQQTATAIQSGTKTGSTATITTQAAHGLTSGATVFIAGTSPAPNQAGYDGTYVITVPTGSTTTFTITVSTTAPASIGSGGTVYTSALQNTNTVTSVSTVNVTPSPAEGPPFATALATTPLPHGLSAGQTFQISGTQGPSGTYSGIYNGVFTVGAVISSNTFHYKYYFGTLPFPTENPGPTTFGGTVTSAGIEAVNISTLTNQSITLDDSMTNISARLFFFVAATGSASPSISLNGISPADPAPPPFGPSATLPNSIFDIVEFAYLPTGVTSTPTLATYTTTAPHGLAVNDQVTISDVTDAEGNKISFYNGSFTVATVPDAMTFTVSGTYSSNPQGGGGTVNTSLTISPSFSTFDVSAVDGLAIPMTLTASQVKAGNASSVGINTGPGFTREAIGTAFGTFMTNDPLGHVVPPNPNPAARDFSKLRYNAATPVFKLPFLPAGQFNAITAPKDWLANQPSADANADPLASFWDTTIDNFFRNGNTLSIYLGKDAAHPIYSGSSDGTQFTLSNGVETHHFSKPAAGLASALYVWSQPNPGSGNRGLLQDQIWQALCRGVALDGVNPATINVQAATSTGWVPPVTGVHNPLGVATITTSTPHGLPLNSTPNVAILGVSQTDYNGIRAVTVTGANTFTFTYQPNSGNPYGSIAHASSGAYEPLTNTTPVTVTMTPGGTVPAQGDTVYLTTISVAGYNGQQVVTGSNPSGNTFTYSLPGNQTLGTGNGGIVWGGLYAPGTGGTVDAGGSSTAWNSFTNWYTQHTSTAFPSFQSVYCPYSKFLHDSTLQGTVDTTGTSSIYLHNAAYGFGEDENPIGNPYTGPLVPSKLDGTVFDDSSVTIRLAPWTATVTRPAIDLNGDGIQDVVWHNETAGTYVGWVYDANGGVSAVRVLIGAPWTLAAVGYFDADDVTDFVWRYDGTGPNAGANVLWNMNADGTIKSNVGFGGSPDVSLETSGDYNGDGITDLVWKMPSTDHLVWIMNAGGTVAATKAFATQSGTWQLAPTGADYDANGDGRSDLIWFNGSAHVVYLMSGAATPAVATLPPGPAEPNLVATGDFNGDGIGDLVWGAVGSSTVVQQLMGFTTVPVVQSQSPVVGDAGTEVEDSAVFWGREIVWRNIASGVDSVWTMSGSTATTKKTYGGSPAWRLIRRPGSV